jgi:transposase, IS30 family
VAITLPPKVRAQIRRLHREGVPKEEIAASLGQSYLEVGSVLRLSQQGGERLYCPSAGRLSLTQREEILIGLGRDETYQGIAARIGRATSTISREVAKNGGRLAYRASWAHRCAGRLAKRPKATKLEANEALWLVVERWLKNLWSPQEIAQRLRHEYPDDPMMWVSHETIYQSLYVQGRGELRAELTRCLRTGRAQRRPRGARSALRRPIPEMVMISERPAEVADRAVPGHWEGDLIMGTNNRSAVGTLVERSTRYVLLLHLPNGKRAEDVRHAMEAAIATLPAKLARSITWDQGTEMFQHREFTIATGIPVYFCDPHAPWQRGSNENTNGLLRQFMPKGTDLSVYTRADLDEFERMINGRPRQTLGWLKPCEKLEELIASTP